LDAAIILFLDIDGVLNTKNCLRKQATNGNKPSAKKWCPIAVSHINLLVEKIGAKIVVSSTWRFNHSIDELRDFFENNGINRNSVIGITPNLLYERHSSNRGDELQAWIDENDAHSDLHIIIDDNDDGISERFDHYIQTNMNVGFADRELIEKCFKILNNAGYRPLTL